MGAILKFHLPQLPFKKKNKTEFILEGQERVTLPQFTIRTGGPLVTTGTLQAKN